MNRPAVTAAVAVCRVVLGDVSFDMADALAAAEAWASGEEPSLDEYLHLYSVLGKDEPGEAVYWVLSAAYESDDEESDYCLVQALATLDVLHGWDNGAVYDLYEAMLAPRDTMPAPAPECQEAA